METKHEWKVVQRPTRARLRLGALDTKGRSACKEVTILKAIPPYGTQSGKPVRIKVMLTWVKRDGSGDFYEVAGQELRDNEPNQPFKATLHKKSIGEEPRPVPAWLPKAAHKLHKPWPVYGSLEHVSAE